MRTRSSLVLLTLAVLAVVPPARAATPTSHAAVAVSAVVLPRCDNTACRDIPPVVGIRRQDDPAFDLSRVDDRRVVTMTY